ncbi:hypothetical protein LINPERPRIM_LOCUS43219 [Linum perenne]
MGQQRRVAIFGVHVTSLSLLFALKLESVLLS